MIDPQTVQLEYDGSRQPPQSGAEDAMGREYRPYIPDDSLKEAVRLAIALDMPLLLEGDPGCGKTCLAGAIAYEFTQKYCQEMSDEHGDPLWYPFETWNVTSSTRAVDGRYTYDALRRLRDAQLSSSANLKELAANLGEGGEEEVRKMIRNLQNPRNYLKLGKLGWAFSRVDYRPILLIDEIDKADSDFPNDLLRELEEYRFEIPETGDIVPDPNDKDRVKKPMIIITSNREKPLPDPFLRRCIYYYVEFPTPGRLEEIIHQRFGPQEGVQAKICDAVLTQFFRVRTVLSNRPGSRPPGTSEFLKFFEAVMTMPTDVAEKQLNKLGKQRSLLGIMVKTKADLDLVSQDLESQPVVIGVADGDD